MIANADRHEKKRSRRMHPLPLRIMHWINAISMILMVMSGWKIYNDEVIFGFLHFPDEITLGVWAQHALQWHRLLLPIRLREIIQEMVAALTFRLKHADLTHYNAVQKLLYVGVILIIILQVATGIAIWKPVQFSGLVSLFGGFQGARLAHFLGMTAIVLFVLVHVTLALLVPKTILAMLTGGPRVSPSGSDDVNADLR
jgi:thiosulfate reductase cytochrome b subunit